MVIVNPWTVPSAEPRIVTGVVRRVWRDVREDGKYQLVRKFENYKNRADQISIRSKDLTRELVLRLDWSAGDCRDTDCGMVVGWWFLPRACVKKKVEVFSQ